MIIIRSFEWIIAWPSIESLRLSIYLNFTLVSPSNKPSISKITCDTVLYPAVVVLIVFKIVIVRGFLKLEWILFIPVYSFYTKTQQRSLNDKTKKLCLAQLIARKDPETVDRARDLIRRKIKPEIWFFKFFKEKTSKAKTW